MQPTFSKQDTLSDIEYDNPDLDREDPDLLVNQISSISGTITILAAFGASLVLDYRASLKAINFQIVLQTPVGSKVLASGELTRSDPTVTVGGSIDSFKAKATVSMDFLTAVLTAEGEVCVPVIGCKKGKVSIRL